MDLIWLKVLRNSCTVLYLFITLSLSHSISESKTFTKYETHLLCTLEYRSDVRIRATSTNMIKMQDKIAIFFLVSNESILPQL